jgi:hypothetical protein
MTIKEEVLNVISNLPENADIEDIMYKLYVIDKIHKGQDAIKNNKVITNEDLKKEIATW